MARLDRLAPAKEVAQAGAAIGREFSHRLLAAVLAQMTAARLDDALAELVKAELLIRRGIEAETVYSFKHALVRDTAYNSMLKSQRVLRHRDIAAAIERIAPKMAAAQPELLAQHHQEAGNTQRAVEQWTKAGKLAISRGANREGAASFERALALLAGFPETTQTMSDALDLRIALGPALMGVHGGGASRTETSYQAAVALAERLGDGARLFTALWGQSYVNWQRGRFAECVHAGRRLLDVARANGDSEQLVEAHHALWSPLVWMGQPREGLFHLEQGEALYDPDRHASLRYRYGGHDPHACCAIHSAIASWLLGFADRASREMVVALARIDASQHPMTSTLLSHASWVSYQRGERAAAAAFAERLVSVAGRYEFQAWASPAVVLTELAPGKQPTTERLALLDGSIAATSSWLLVFARCVVVELYGLAGEVDLALRVLEALGQDGYDHAQGPELHRLEGALLLQRSPADAGSAEGCFHKAIQVAREQGSKSFELRAATSLARLWQQQGKRDEARRLLGHIHGWFTEGFDTADLKNAKALLDELA